MGKISNRFVKPVMFCVPQFIWCGIEKVLKNRVSSECLEQLRLERYGKYLLRNFDKEWTRAKKNRKCMSICRGEYGYKYFNIAYVNNIVALIIYALYKGCIPVIKINENEPDYNKWDWYFKQPYETMETDITGFEYIECDICTCSLTPKMQMVYSPNEWKSRLFKMIFRRFLQFNHQTKEYIQDEIEKIGKTQQMLGVLMRGTDYLKLKPAGHPVQPQPEEIVEKVKEIFLNNNYSAVYVATEEKKLFDLVAKAVGKENVRENKRRYYDEIFYQSNLELIGRVQFERENDNYWKGLEYLSSLVILSKCHTLVAGNCGGTLFAMMMADYQKPYIFDYGVYH